MAGVDGNAWSEDGWNEAEARAAAVTTPPDVTTWPASPPSFNPPSVPDRIGRYVIEAEIGSGGMGRVYAASDSQLDRAVAVKVVRAGMNTPASIDRFLAESRMLARIEDPGIARVYDCGIDAGMPYFVMERVVGAVSLTTYAESAVLSLSDRLRLFMRVCDAVHAAHRRGIVHRDLKPSNILVSLTDPSHAAQPKVIDFGVAEEVRAGEESRHGGVAGTLEYMSPEQCIGGPVDARSDVYSLGVVLFQLLSGKLPYAVPGNGLTAESIRVIRTHEPAPLSLYGPEFRGDLDAIVQRALEKKPEERYQSASQLRRDIRRYLEGQPVEARSRNRVYVAVRRAASGWRKHTSFAMAILALAAYGLSRMVGVPLVYEYTPLDRTYAAMLTLVPAAARLSEVMEHTMIVTLPDSDDVPEAVFRAGLGELVGPPPAADDPARQDGTASAANLYAVTVRRHMMARLIERLIDARPSVIALDLMFIDAPPRDDPAQRMSAMRADATRALAAAADRMRTVAGRAVIGGLPGWADGKDAAALMSPGIEKSLFWGGLTASFPPRQAVVDLFVDRVGQPPIPSLALEAFARRDGNARSRPSIVPGPRRITLHYPDVTDGPTGLIRSTRTADTIGVSRCDEPVWDDEAEALGLRPDDRMGRYVSELPGESFFTPATMSIVDVLGMPDADLTDRFKGKAVIVARLDADMHETDDGRVVPGCWAHAAAIESLLTSKGLIAPTRAESEGLILMGGLLGLWVGGSGRRAGLALRWIGVTVLLVGGSLAAYHFAGYQFNPMVPIVSALVGGALRLGFAPRVAGRSEPNFAGRFA